LKEIEEIERNREKEKKGKECQANKIELINLILFIKYSSYMLARDIEYLFLIYYFYLNAILGIKGFVTFTDIDLNINLVFMNNVQ